MYEEPLPPECDSVPMKAGALKQWLKDEKRRLTYSWLARELSIDEKEVADWLCSPERDEKMIPAAHVPTVRALMRRRMMDEEVYEAVFADYLKKIKEERGDKAVPYAPPVYSEATYEDFKRFNYRLPEELTTLFRQICLRKGAHMMQLITEILYQWVTEELSSCDPERTFKKGIYSMRLHEVADEYVIVKNRLKIERLRVQEAEKAVKRLKRLLQSVDDCASIFAEIAQASKEEVKCHISDDLKQAEEDVRNVL